MCSEYQKEERNQENNRHLWHKTINVSTQCNSYGLFCICKCRYQSFLRSFTIRGPPIRLSCLVCRKMKIRSRLDQSPDKSEVYEKLIKSCHLINSMLSSLFSCHVLIIFVNGLVIIHDLICNLHLRPSHGQHTRLPF